MSTPDQITNVFQPTEAEIKATIHTLGIEDDLLAYHIARSTAVAQQMLENTPVIRY